MKKWILRSTILLVLVNALATLALSQVHILAITKIFATDIGFYLFLFVIFGLTTGFNAYLANKRASIVLYIFTSFLVITSGFIYLRIMQGDVAQQEALTMSDEAIRNSFNLAVASLVIYTAGLIIVPLLGWSRVETAEI